MASRRSVTVRPRRRSGPGIRCARNRFFSTKPRNEWTVEGGGIGGASRGITGHDAHRNKKPIDEAPLLERTAEAEANPVGEPAARRVLDDHSHHVRHPPAAMASPSLPPNLDAYKPDSDGTPDVLDPSHVRVVDVESEDGSTVVRFDCYDGDSKTRIFRLVGDDVQVRAIDWARSPSPEAEVEVQWKSTGLSSLEVHQIRVFSWPMGELVRVHEDIE